MLSIWKILPVQRRETAEHHRDSSVESDDREIGVAFCREFFLESELSLFSYNNSIEIHWRTSGLGEYA